MLCRARATPAIGSPTYSSAATLLKKYANSNSRTAPIYTLWGAQELLQTLFKSDLVDEMELMIIPITLGTGKRLFQGGTVPAAFKVTSSQLAPKGIICVTYQRDGDVKTGAPQIKED